ncbi:MAG: hypothetical protein LBU69_05700 [Deltaproteobacteria bacterium]|nr:hypothetical protein [Deltaproteobacteria bacterium]
MLDNFKQLTDLSVKSSDFAKNVNLLSLEIDPLVQSGVVAHDKALDEFLTNCVNGINVFLYYVHIPYIPKPMSTPSESCRKELALRQSLNKPFGEKDLAVVPNGVDPDGEHDLKSHIAKFWLLERKTRVMDSIQGLIADSLANFGSDLLLDKTLEDGVSSPDNLISKHGIIDAATQLGDQAGCLEFLVVHSAVYLKMKQLGLTEIENFPGTLTFSPRYNILCDDTLTEAPIPAGTNTNPEAPKAYYSYLFGKGAFVTGVGIPGVPIEVTRDALACHGGGHDTLISRVELVIHPRGYKCNLNATPTHAQLQEAGTWTRVWDRKSIPLAVIKTRG